MIRLKKLLLSFLSFLVLFMSSASYFAAPKAIAADTGPWYNQSFTQWFEKVYDEQTSPPQDIFGERYTAAQVQWVMYALIANFANFRRTAIICLIKGGGADSCSASDPLADNSNVEPVVYRGVFATLFDESRTFSGVTYVRAKLASLNMVPHAQAQNPGFGFSALNPIQNIWKICRDIMYGFFVIIIIVFAFMIMFRVKLNPQTVVSVQSAIPKIIITLILVTFSYAIAGFLIDLIYVIIGLVALIFTTTGFIKSDTWNTSQIWSKIFDLLTVGPDFSAGIGGIIGWMLGYFASFAFAVIQSVISLFELSAASMIIGAILGFFIIIGVFIWLIVTSVKLFILLVKTYLMVLLSVIFSPFIIGFGSIMPTGGFSSWLKGLAQNLLIYPLIGALMMVSILFLSAVPGVDSSINDFFDLPDGTHVVDIFGTGTNAYYWYPPLTFGAQSDTWDPLPLLWTFASLGILAVAPGAANMLKSLMAGKGMGEGADLLGKGGALAGGLGMAAATGTALGKGVLGGAGRGFTERVIVPRAQAVSQGGGTFVDRWVSGMASRRGWIQAWDPRTAGNWRAKGTFGPPGERGQKVSGGETSPRRVGGASQIPRRLHSRGADNTTTEEQANFE